MPYLDVYCVASPLNSRMGQSVATKDTSVTVDSNGVARQAPRPRSYSKVMNHLLKSYAHDEAFAEAGTALLRFTYSANMTTLQYGEALFAKTTLVGDVDYKGTLNAALIDRANE